MSRVLIGIISGVGGLIIGGFGGRKTSNITMGDVIAAPGKGMSAVFGGVKWTGRKIGSGLSSLAFWKKKKEVKKGKVNLKKDYQDLTVKHAKLSDDFSETAKRMNLVEVELGEKDEQLRQAKEMNDTYQNTVNDQDEDLKKAATDLKQETVDKQKAVSDLKQETVDKLKALSDLKVAQTTIAKMQKATPES